MRRLLSRALTAGDPSADVLQAKFFDNVATAAKARNAAAWAIQRARKVAGSTMLKIKFYRIEDPKLEWYLVMVTIHQDGILIKLGNDCDFPRGFPVLWSPVMDVTQSFGFRAKFSNDDMSGPTFSTAPAELVASFKWSGLLDMLIAFRHPVTHELCWMSTTKNSADYGLMPLSRAAGDAWEEVATEKLIGELVSTGRHLCGEALLDIDKVHGHDYKHRNGTSTVVITACGTGGGRWSAKPEQDRPVVFCDIEDLFDLCERNNLIMASALHVKGPKACAALLKAMDKSRDMLDAAKFVEIADRIKAEHGAVEYGCFRDHLDVCGHVLEGWVLMSDTGEIRKYKLPAYTIRTMYLRTLMGGVNATTPNVPAIEAYKRLLAYVHRWTTTHPTEWTHAGWELYLRWCEAGRPRRVAADEAAGKAAPHIAIADAWEAAGRPIRPGIQAMIDTVRDTAVVMVSPFVVYVPAEEVATVAGVLHGAGLPVTTELKKRGAVSTKAPTVYLVSTKPGRRLNGIETVVFNTMKVQGIDHARRIDPSAEVALAVILKSNCIIKPGGEVEEAERRLRDASDAFVASVVTHARAHPDDKILVLPVAPQCTGKTTAALRVMKALGRGRVDVTSADDEMARLSEDGSFVATLLGEAHKSCVLKTWMSTKHVVIVDNTNFPTDTGVYDMVAKATGRTVFRIPYAVDVWKRGVADAAMIQALLARNIRRAKLTIDPEAIFKTVDRFATAVGQAESPEAWVLRVDYPSPDAGMGWCNNALAYTSPELSEAMITMSEKVPLENRIYKTLRDGYHKFHVTVLSPAETRKHKKTTFATKTKPTVVGLGHTVKDGAPSWYAVVEWEEATEFRSELNLPIRDFHCTLGFGPTGDVHEVPKGRETLV